MDKLHLTVDLYGCPLAHVPHVAHAAMTDIDALRSRRLAAVAAAGLQAVGELLGELLKGFARAPLLRHGLQRGVPAAASA